MYSISVNIITLWIMPSLVSIVTFTTWSMPSPISVVKFTTWSTPSLVSVVTFTTCIFVGEKLIVGMVFPTKSIFKILQEPIRNFPQALISITQAMVSLDRLNRYMTNKELDPEAVEMLSPNKEIFVVVENSTFFWDEEVSKSTLQNINLEVRSGSLVEIIGTVGSGNSSSLSSILGDEQKLSSVV